MVDIYSVSYAKTFNVTEDTTNSYDCILKVKKISTSTSL